jgi:hypothetical protein
MRHFHRLLAIPRSSFVRPFFKQQRLLNAFHNCRRFAQESSPVKEMPEVVTHYGTKSGKKTQVECGVFVIEECMLETPR